MIRLQNELGTTTIYVTHDQVEAMTMGHRVAIMNGGHIEQVASPLDLFRRPSNRFVAAEFMGHPGINLFRGVITNTGGRSAFAGEGVLVPLQADYPTGDVWLGIRPAAFDSDVKWSGWSRAGQYPGYGTIGFC